MNEEMISVIVPVYNVEKYVEKCLESLLQQTYADIEIICIDDKSTDNSAQICERIGKEDARVRLIKRKQNTGLASVRNLGLKEAAGEYVVFVDSDDWVTPDYLETLYQLLTEHEADIAQGSYVRTAIELGEESLKSGAVKTVCMTGRSALCRMFSAPMTHPDVEYTIVPNKLYRKSLLEGISFPEGKIFEDQYFSALCFLKCRKVAATDKKIYFYRKNPQGTTMQKYSIRFLDEIELHERLIKHFEGEGEHDLAAMVCARDIPLAIDHFYQAEHAGCTDAEKKAYLHVLKEFGNYLRCRKVPGRHKLKTLVFLLFPPAFVNLKFDVNYRETIGDDGKNRMA